MAIKKISEEADKFSIEIDNGDFEALTKIVDQLNFVDKEKALRFAIGVLLRSGTNGVFITDDAGNKVRIVPGEALIKKTEQI